MGTNSGTNTKAGVKSEKNLSLVTHAIISINKGGDTYQDFDLKKVKISDWGSGTLVSDEIRLWVGSDYELIRFELQDKDNKTLYAAPLKGSTLASKVSKPLAVDFSVEEDRTTPLEVEVLSTASANPSDFGFVQFKVNIVSNSDTKMVLVNGGTFDIVVPRIDGSDKEDTYKVTLNNYYIAKYEVTQDQWFDIMGTKPNGFVGGQLPVNNVSKKEALEFIKKLNAKTGESYRLPTEAEWLFAARGGNKSKAYKYAGVNDLNQVAWHKKNSGMKVHPVGEKVANELGLFDMSGNVCEWCSDTYDFAAKDKLVYDNYVLTNPKNVKGDYSVARGGAAILETLGNFMIDKNGENDLFYRGKSRSVHSSDVTFEYIGFRLVKEKK